MIRPATPEDAAQAISLLLLAMGSIGNLLTGVDDEAETAAVLEAFFREEGNRLSHRHTLVAERNGSIVGALVAYHGSRSEELDRPFLERQRAHYGQVWREIPREPRPDEYYLDSLAVAEAHRGQGVATALISAFEANAIALAHDKVALLAEESNIPAYRLYRRLGYEADGTLTIDGHEFHHMVKRLL